MTESVSAPLILALETANEHCSVALKQAEQQLFFEQNHAVRMQTQLILPMVERALQQTGLTWQDLDVIAFSRGPGAFSGVRINAAVAQALAWANDLPVVAVSTLQAMAQYAYRQLGLTAVSVALDARMNEVYFANFSLEQGVMQLRGDEQLLSYTQALQQATATVVGNGTILLDQDVAIEAQQIYADAIAVADLANWLWQNGQTVSPDLALPVYLRDNAWKKIAEQKAETK